MPFINERGEVVAAPHALEIGSDQFDQAPATEAQAVSLAFESGVDGRAFSAAGLFRAEGYRGLIVGTGRIGIDRLAYGFRVGFDVLWISNEELSLLTTQHLAPFPSHYQQPTANAS